MIEKDITQRKAEAEIAVLVRKARETNSADEALKFSQAALNVANAIMRCIPAPRSEEKPC